MSAGYQRGTVLFGSASPVTVGLWAHLMAGSLIDQNALSQALFLPRLKHKRHMIFLVGASLTSVIAVKVWQYFHPLPVWEF